MQLTYIGNKKPLKLKMPWLVREYVFHDSPVEVDNSDGNWLLANCPTAFRAATVEPVFSGSEDDEPIIVGELKCPKCGKEYKDDFWFNRHVEKCDEEA